ncbi:MAG: hypothetical protein IJ361_05210 [Spirochaetaceae bacterium]|nr:hypothetical protein [Spirochaetaceae bacterium]
MTPIMPITPIGSVSSIDSISSINLEETEIWTDYYVSRIFGLESKKKKEISLRNTFDSENSISSFQKMLESEMLKLDSDCVSNAKGREEHIDISKQSAFEKKYFENTRNEFIYWNNILVRMLEVTS